jgi:hypothetical protein
VAVELFAKLPNPPLVPVVVPKADGVLGVCPKAEVAAEVNQHGKSRTRRDSPGCPKAVVPNPPAGLLAEKAENPVEGAEPKAEGAAGCPNADGVLGVAVCPNADVAAGCPNALVAAGFGKELKAPLLAPKALGVVDPKAEGVEEEPKALVVPWPKLEKAGVEPPKAEGVAPKPVEAWERVGDC